MKTLPPFQYTITREQELYRESLFTKEKPFFKINYKNKINHRKRKIAMLQSTITQWQGMLDNPVTDWLKNNKPYIQDRIKFYSMWLQINKEELQHFEQELSIQQRKELEQELKSA